MDMAKELFSIMDEKDQGQITLAQFAEYLIGLNMIKNIEMARSMIKAQKTKGDSEDTLTIDEFMKSF
jgi:Ca2+-binding EF-hand superfamily protein